MKRVLAGIDHELRRTPTVPRKKKENTIWQASKANQAKSFQIILEILQKWYDIMG